MLAIFGGGERFFQKVVALAGLKIQFKITNHRMDVLYIKVFCLPLQRQWFTAQVIKRESGENPGQSRCCKLSFRRRRRSHWSNIGKTGKASAPDNKVRRPALPKLHSGPEGWARSEIRVTYKPPPAPQKGESHAASDFSACLQEQAGISGLRAPIVYAPLYAVIQIKVLLYKALHPRVPPLWGGQEGLQFF